jgi:hypothetical protein
VFPFDASLPVVNSIQLNFCLEVFDLDLFARVAFVQNGWFKTHVIFPGVVEIITKISHGCAMFTFRLSDVAGAPNV